MWRRARSLGPRDWLHLGEAAAALAWAHAILRWSSPARVIGRATRVTRARAASFTDAQLTRLVWTVGVAGRRVVRVPCQSRAVALARMLARRGVVVEIRVGVRTIDGRLEAHAWVERDGRPMGEDQATIGRYAPFARPLTDLAAVRAHFR